MHQKYYVINEDINLLSNINLAQQDYTDKLFDIIQTPTEEMIAESLTTVCLQLCDCWGRFCHFVTSM